MLLLPHGSEPGRNDPGAGGRDGDRAGCRYGIFPDGRGCGRAEELSGRSYRIQSGSGHHAFRTRSLCLQADLHGRLLRHADRKASEEEDSGDLLGRKEATNTEDFQKYLDLIESASIDYKTSSLPFNFTPPKGSNNTITIKVDLDGEGTTFEPKVLKFDGDSFAANPSDILNTFPLKPSVQFEIPEGILGIPRKMDFTANINLTVKTNGKVAVWEKNAKNGGEE